MPRTIGVITSRDAAALRDVLTTLKRRNPSIGVVLYPVPVQGYRAAEEIASALALAGRRKDCEVLLLVRGGAASRTCGHLTRRSWLARCATARCPW